MKYRLPILVVAATIALAPWTWSEESPKRPDLPEPHPDLPPEFKQLLPKGRIAAVDEPRFVKAADAEIADDAWVLGVVIDGQARAYSLNLLNRHEVVNDRFGDQPIAAVW